MTAVLVGLVRFYQKAREGRPSPCRFTPSCSTYAIEALQTRGLVSGGVLAVRRLGRCRPLGGKGWDPVPPNSGAAQQDGPDDLLGVSRDGVSSSPRLASKKVTP